MLRCPVRGCGLALEPAGRQWVCERRHSFDLARSGYLNLLQPQDRKSLEAGDAAEAVAARRRLHDRGITAPLLAGITALSAPVAGEPVVDLGCGEGFYLGSLAEKTGCDGWGLDLSTAAIDAAARRYTNCHWIVGNGDRTLPFRDGSASLILSITGRINPIETRRILAPGGRLLVAVAAPNDLIELRGEGRDRVTRTVGDFAAAGFCLTVRERASATVDLDEAGQRDLRLAIYRPRGTVAEAGIRVTFALDLLLLET